MAKSKKELIIESFQKMDLNMLDALLDQRKTYQGATKDMFIEKVYVAFSQLKKDGDTFLSSHEGFCNSNKCANKNCDGYSFIGNRSKNHIDLIFEEWRGVVNGIYHCDVFQTIDKSIETENQICIEIKNDEKATFNPGVDFLIKSQKCKLAYEELTQYQNTTIDKTIYIPWIEKHFELDKSLHGRGFSSSNDSELDKFYWLYYRINELLEFLQYDNLATQAINEYSAIDTTNESQLLKWLAKYEEPGQNLVLFIFEEVDYDYPENSEYFEHDGFKINTFDFWHIFKFKSLFDQYYWGMVEKYNTYKKDMKTNWRIPDNYNSLSYHLIQRGIQL